MPEINESLNNYNEDNTKLINFAQDLIKKCEDFFSPTGILRSKALAANRPYEFRPQQLLMAKAIINSFLQGKNLSVEAPTGVGKSFAYLVPLIFRAEYAKQPALISTETINLQEQLIHKDIPFLKELTGIKFNAVLAKGRSNYICLRRLELLNGETQASLLPLPSMALELEKINDAIKENLGERNLLKFKISPELWSMIFSDGGNCQMKKCPHCKKCFYLTARKEWDNADIIVANHALFFTDMRVRLEDAEQALLPDCGVVVIDEAHTLEANAADYLGLYLSRAGINSLLNGLYNPDNAKGLLLQNGEKALALRKMVSDMRGEVFGFFQQFENLLKQASETTLQITKNDTLVDTLSPFFVHLYNELGNYIDELENATIKTEITSLRQRCCAVIDGISEFINVANSSNVYYIEAERNNIILRGAPLNVSEILSQNLFNNRFSTILSSATLTIDKNFAFFHNRIGFSNGQELILDSPFDSDLVRAFVPKNIPDPTAINYFSELVSYIKFFIKQTEGKAFVLFTSYSLLHKTADAMADFFEDNNINLLVQGGNLNRSLMLEEFKKDINSVIFGTDSFWTGVDVPGEALSNVIITKLPFAVPNHPLIAARHELITKQGGNAFNSYTIPEAILKFRQGVGRLIRSRNDSGIIAILDSRIITKYYGKKFINSIPYTIEII